MKDQNAKKGSAKNVILTIISIILFCYAGFILIVPIKFNDALKNKDILQELDKLTNLKVDYDSAKMKITPKLEVVYNFTNLRAEKKDIEMQVGSASKATFVFNPLMLFSKNFIMKHCTLTGVEYYEVIDSGVPEIKTFLEKYSLLATAGGSYSITACPIKIKYLTTYSYNTTSDRYRENRRDEVVIEPETVSNFINVVSQGVIKTQP